jgi:hypothetical protein
VGKPEEDLYADRRIIIKWILEKYDGVLWTGLIWLRIGISGKLFFTR